METKFGDEAMENGKGKFSEATPIKRGKAQCEKSEPHVNAWK